jgi:abortive infection bacteriophage resistance protein
MKYSKPPLSFEAQADLLISRGLIADRLMLISRLKSASYYRLSGYLFPFRNPDDTYKPGTTFQRVWSYYAFDRQLRLLVLDAIERVEIAVRTNFVYAFAHQYGPFGYTLPENLPELEHPQHTDFLEKIGIERKRNREIFVKHFQNKYGDCHDHLPLWMASELMTFGMLLTFINGAGKSMRQRLGAIYGVSDDVLLSWMRAISGVRNICAHHGRLWNRELGYQPFIPKKHKHLEWHIPVEVQSNRVFGVLTVLKFFLKQVAPQSHWQIRLEDLLKRYPDVPRRPMGFAENWKECPIWK